MTNETKLLLKRLRLYYYSFRLSPYAVLVLPFFSLTVCFFIVWLFVIPQVQQWFSLQNEIAGTQERIKTIQNNIQFMRLISDESIEKDAQIGMKALPIDKYFAGILDTISESAAIANISLNDYSFSLDDGKQVAKPGMAAKVLVSFAVEGTAADIESFIKEVEKRLPLSEITALDFINGRSQIAISFYTKPLPKLPFEESQPLTPLNNQDRETLRVIEQMN